MAFRKRQCNAISKPDFSKIADPMLTPFQLRGQMVVFYYGELPCFQSGGRTRTRTLDPLIKSPPFHL